MSARAGTLPRLMSDTEALSRYFRVLGDPTRLRIVEALLERERTVSELVDLLGAPQSRVSNHLACLRWCRFVDPERHGRTVVYRATRAGVTQLFRRDLDMLEAVPIPGTENATGPFFSPDGQWLGFDADGVLKRVALSGGAPVVISNAPGGVTATWLADGTIVLATNTTRVLQRVSASGGTPEARPRSTGR